AGRAEIGHMRTLVVGRDLEAGAGARRVLFEDQGDVLAREPRHLVAGPLRRLKIGRQPQQVPDLITGEIVQAQYVAAVEVDRHRSGPRSFQSGVLEEWAMAAGPALTAVKIALRCSAFRGT